MPRDPDEHLAPLQEIDWDAVPAPGVPQPTQDFADPYWSTHEGDADEVTGHGPCID